MWLLLAVAFPAVFVNLGHGHNGFLTAALFGAALVTLDRRPIVAGILFGLLAYKPQFGVLIPLVLIASGRWRCFAAAAATVALFALATTLAFGADVWDAFLASTRFTRIVVLEQGDTGWHKIQSVFSWVRMWGGSIALAYAVQGAVTVARRRGAGVAVAQRGAVRAQGRGAVHRRDSRHALQPRLRHDAARARHRLRRGRRLRARLRPVGEDGARRALAGAARRPQHRAGDVRSARRAGPCSRCLC